MIMDKGLLSQRYASSLFEVAHDHQVDKQVLDTMRLILWLHQHEPSFQQTLNVPVVLAREKMRLLQRVSPFDSWWLLERFFRILIRNIGSHSSFV
jgi:F0F1-type ATP synthase, delta subunit (mitochondrial oligomycin sensitivity protein)